MREYYEALETVLFPIVPEFIRIEITDKTPAERSVVLADIQAIMVGKTYKLGWHECYHEASLPCILEALN